MTEALLQKEKLSSDDTLIMNKLDNGLKYYLKKNDIPLEKGSLGLVVKVGSICEKEEEKGIAHFIEHLCLREDDYCNDSIQMYGYTNFHQTCYTIKCFSKNFDIIEKCLIKLKEIVQHKNFSQEKIDNEREIIKIEFEKVNSSLNSKLRNRVLPIILNNSHYCKRMPLGDMKNIEIFTKEALMNFYKYWYNPKFMALIVVGDFDILKIEEWIKLNFSLFKNNSKVNIPQYLIPDYEEVKIVYNCYTEILEPKITLYFKENNHHIESNYDLKYILLENLFHDLVTNLIKSSTRNNASCIKENFNTKCSFTVITANLKENLLSSQLEKVLSSISSINHGFTLKEFNDTKEAFFTLIKSNYDKEIVMNTAFIFKEYVRDFIFDKPIVSSNDEFLFIEKFIHNVTMKDIEEFTFKLSNNTNIVIVLDLPEAINHASKELLFLIEHSDFIQNVKNHVNQI